MPKHPLARGAPTRPNAAAYHCTDGAACIYLNDCCAGGCLLAASAARHDLPIADVRERALHPHFPITPVRTGRRAAVSAPAALKREIEQQRKALAQRTREARRFRRGLLDLASRGHGIMRPKWLLAIIAEAEAASHLEPVTAPNAAGEGPAR